MNWFQYMNSQSKKRRKIIKLLDKLETFPDNRNSKRWLRELKDLCDDDEYQYWLKYLGLS